MARLTWQNVTAPSFEDALRGTAYAGQLLNQGFSGLGDVATGFRERAVRDNTSDATAKLMQAAAAAGGGQAGRDAVNAILASGQLGYKPQDLSPDFGKTVDDMLSAYLDREGTIATTGLTRAQTTESIGRNRRADEMQPYDINKKIADTAYTGALTTASIDSNDRANQKLPGELTEADLRNKTTAAEFNEFLYRIPGNRLTFDAIVADAEEKERIRQATEGPNFNAAVNNAETGRVVSETGLTTALSDQTVANNDAADLSDEEAERLAAEQAAREAAERERRLAEEGRAGEALANELARSMMFTPAQLKEEITQNSNLTPAGIEAALSYLGGVDPTVYTPSGDSQKAASQSPLVVDARAITTGIRRAVEQAYDVDNVVRYYAEAQANDDGTTAQEFVDQYSKNEANADTAGDAAALLKLIRINYPKVPDSLAKRVIEDSVRGRLGGLIAGDSRIDDPRVKEILGAYNDNPGEIAEKADRYVGLSETFNKIEQDISALEAEKALAIQRGDPGAAIAIDQRIFMLKQDITNMTKSNATSSYGSIPDGALRYLYRNAQQPVTGSTPVTGRPTNGKPGNSSSRRDTR